MTTRLLKLLGACPESIEYAQTQPDLETAWAKCERGDWLLWFAARRNVKRETLVLSACECARLALPYAKGEAALKCIKTAEAWAKGTATIEQVRMSADAVDAAYAYASAAAYASADAASAYAAADVAYAAADVASASAYAAAYAAAYADYKGKRAEVLKQCADIVRKYFPTLP